MDPVDVIQKLTEAGLSAAQLTKILLDARHNNKREAWEHVESAANALAAAQDALAGAVDDHSKALDENTKRLRETLDASKKVSRDLKKMRGEADDERVADELKKMRKDVKGLQSHMRALAADATELEQLRIALAAIYTSLDRQSSDLRNLIQLIESKYGRP